VTADFYFGITIGRFFNGFLTVGLDSKHLIRLGQGIAAVGILLHQTPERFGERV